LTPIPKAPKAEEVRLVLPYPLSANRYWRSYVPKGWNRALVAPSDEAKVYKREVARMAKEQGAQPIVGPVEYTLELYPRLPQDWAKRVKKDPLWWDLTVQCIDLDNARKVMLDALAGICFRNDSRIRKDPGEIMVPDGEARCVITFRAYERAHPQAPLFDALDNGSVIRRAAPRGTPQLPAVPF